MNFDFSLVLLVLIVVTGVIWGLDTLFFKTGREAAGDSEAAKSESTEPVVKEPLVVEYARFLFPVVVIVFLLRGFLFEPFRIPSGSMLPTLEIGDFILVNKFSYGVRIPVWNKKVVELGAPKRGDVVVFRYPKDTSVDYIKRIIGLPGDKITYYNKTVYINGEPIRQEIVGDYKEHIPGLIKVYQEQFGDMDHKILREPGKVIIDDNWVVPANSYFAMGDNRDNSNDSRFWGFVPDQNLVGKAVFVWMNWGSWSRIGTAIH